VMHSVILVPVLRARRLGPSSVAAVGVPRIACGVEPRTRTLGAVPRVARCSRVATHTTGALASVMLVHASLVPSLSDSGAIVVARAAWKSVV